MKKQIREKQKLAKQKAVAAKALAQRVLAQRAERLKTIHIAAVVVSLALLWLCGNAFWNRVAIGDMVVSGVLTDSQLERFVTEHAADYRLKLRYPDGKTAAFRLDDLGISANARASVHTLRDAQNAPSHWIAWWRPVPVKLSMHIDETAFRTFINEHATLVSQPARDASLKLENGKVVLEPGANGQQYSFENPTRSLLTAAQSLNPTPLPLTTVAREPAVSERTLAPAKAQLERILGQKINIAIGGQTVTPSPANIASWLRLTPSGNSVTIELNRDELRGYLNTLAEEYTRDPRSRVISDATGAVLEAGANGVKVQNNITVTDELAGKVLGGDGLALSMPVTTTPFRTVQAPVAGKWIEVDLTAKRMYAYDNGQVVRSFLVSAGAAGTPTVTGRYAIYAKYASQDMSGLNTDGSRYFQPNVPYVNYFYRDYAIHGNYWRPASYFGYINSSHGCVGIPVSEGAWIYSWAPIGTPVIIHY